MKILPHGDRIYIILDDFQEKVGVLELPKKHTEQSRFATIKACGEDVEKSRFKVGDRILIGYGSGMRVHLIKYGITDDTHRIITSEEIWAKIEDEDGE